MAETPRLETHRAVKVGVGVILTRRDSVLIGRRRGVHGAGTWALPGGHLEFGETVETCARREALEETGLVVEKIEPASFTDDYFEQEGRHYVTLFVQATGFTGEPRNLEPELCDGWHWRRWDDLPEPLFLPLANLRAQGFRPRGA